MILEYPNLKGLFPVGRNKMTPEDFAYQIDKAYAGLGIPTLYGVLSILANKSVFFIGERGTGKTRIIKSVPELENTYVSKWDTFTYSEL
jgi:MoxR-like ATPase